MNILLTVNDRRQAMLMHDRPFDFQPAWVEFSHDEAGVRLISEEGRSYRAGALMNPAIWAAMHNLGDIYIVQMVAGRTVDWTIVPLVNQDYDALELEEQP